MADLIMAAVEDAAEAWYSPNRGGKKKGNGEREDRVRDERKIHNEKGVIGKRLEGFLQRVENARRDGEREEGKQEGKERRQREGGMKR